MHMIKRDDGGRTNSTLYKTELCRSWMQTNGKCSYGERCQYAHGTADVRQAPRHPKYKTELCHSYHYSGTCNYGPRCHFIHDFSEYKQVVPGNGVVGYFVQAPMPNWQQMYSPTNYYPAMVVQPPMVVEQQPASLSGSNVSESSGGDSSIGSDSGEREPFTDGFMDPKLWPGISGIGDFSPFDKKHEILGNLFADRDAMAFTMPKRLPVFTHLSPSKKE